MPKKDEYVKFKNFERKTKSNKLFQYLKIIENKIQMRVILINIKNMFLAVMVINQCVDDKFSKRFKSYVGEDTLYNFISCMIKKSKYYSDVMKKLFYK